MKKVYKWEPWFFVFFGLFHMHRIWALIDRKSYASFWMGIMEERGAVYFILMGILAALCVLGIAAFIKNSKNNYLWRWIYIFGGGYLLFDLFAIATKMEFWSNILNVMFDIDSPYWNIIWLFFIALGAAVFVLGISLFKKTRNNKGNNNG